MSSFQDNVQLPGNHPEDHHLDSTVQAEVFNADKHGRAFWPRMRKQIGGLLALGALAACLHNSPPSLTSASRRLRGMEGEAGIKDDACQKFADQAFQIRGSQADVDRVLGVDCSQREAEYNKIKGEVGNDPDCTKWADGAFQIRGSQADVDRVLGVDCSQREAEYSKINNEVGNEGSTGSGKDVEKLFDEFIKAQGKHYDEAERQKRMQIFADNAKLVAELNANEADNAEYSLRGPFADWDHDEFVANRLLSPKVL
jgi:hypothetical protein